MPPRTLVAALLASLLAGPALAGKANDTLVYASDSEPENVSPYHNSAREGVILARNCWDTLVYRNTKTGAYEPMLATSWKWVDDTTLDLVIREGVTFHNGDALGPEDVAFTFNYVLTPEARTVTRQNVDWMKSTEVTGPHSVRIHLKQPFPAALEYLAGPTPIFPAAYFKKVGLDGFAKAPVGSGPYKIVSVDSGRGVKMERFAQYWAGSPLGTPKIGKLEFRVIPDGESRMAELMTGGVDWIWRVPSDQADQLRAAPNITILNSETMRVGFLQFDTLGRAKENSPQGCPRPAGDLLRHRPEGDGRQPRPRLVAGDERPVLHRPVRLRRSGRDALSLRPGQGQGPAQGRRLPERVRDRSRRLPGAGLRRGGDRLSRRGRHQGAAQLPALRRLPRHPALRQGLHRLPDLGLVLGERRLGLRGRLLPGRRGGPDQGSRGDRRPPGRRQLDRSGQAQGGLREGSPGGSPRRPMPCRCSPTPPTTPSPRT